MNELPCSPEEAVSRALSIANAGGAYILGTGDYVAGRTPDVPWTTNTSGFGSDCAGFAECWCYKIKRHRPGYNRSSGAKASVVDDINCNSALEDAQNVGELFKVVEGQPQPGDLVLYPSFESHGVKFIGHVCIVVSTARVTQWSAAHPPYDMLDVAQCKGPNGRTPAVILTDGSIWSHHDSMWPLPQHRSWVIRPSNAPIVSAPFSTSFRKP